MPVDYSYTGIENANDVIHEVEIEPSNLETIDFAFYDFINEKMNLFTTSNEGFKKAPIIWASAERSGTRRAGRLDRYRNGEAVEAGARADRRCLDRRPGDGGGYGLDQYYRDGF